MFNIGDNETKGQKFEFNFESNFYVLELTKNEIFIATFESAGGDVVGISRKHRADIRLIDKNDIKKIIAIIPVQ